MIIQYPQLEDNNWLKIGCFIGYDNYPGVVCRVTSIVTNCGIKIKVRPYLENISLSNIYHIPNNFVTAYQNELIISPLFHDYFNNNKDSLYLKYKQGLAQCNLCRKKDLIVDYYGNGVYFCQDCKKKTYRIDFKNIEQYINKQPVNYSNEVLKLINLFSDICFEKMNDIKHVENFIGNIINVVLKHNFNFNWQYCLKNKNVAPNKNICKLKDQIFFHLAVCLLNLHNGSKKQQYINIITKQLVLVLSLFIEMRNKSLQK